MKIIIKSLRRTDSGFALLITMVFVITSLIVFSGVMYWISSNAKVTLRNNQFNSSTAAAEAAVETVLSQMNRDFNAQTLTNAAFYSLLLPDQTNWPVQYQFSNTNGGLDQITVDLADQSSDTVSLNSQYSGLYGLARDCTIVAKATPTYVQESANEWTYGVPSTVRESLQFASIPIFQFAIFYNIDLEICPGAGMTINGPVFSNAGIWAGSGLTTFSSSVGAVDKVDTSGIDPFSNGHTGSGGPTFLQAGQPTSGNNALLMPIGTNNNPSAVRAILEIPPSDFAMGTPSAYTAKGQLYLANAADLIISNSASGTNFGSLTPTGTNTIIYYQEPTGTHFTPVANDFYILKTGGTTNYISSDLSAGVGAYTNVQYAGYSFVTNVVFYDWREGWNGGAGPPKKVQAVQIDISKFNTWVTNSATNGGAIYNTQCLLHKTHSIDSMYVYNSVKMTGSTLPAVRVANGQQLPSSDGFTVATPFPMYVRGNYNSQTPAGSSLGLNSTTYTYPAALMADAITILSTTWNDTVTTNNPAPGDTTVNAAMLEGIVPSDRSIPGDYSGGVENFLRLLENWNGHVLTYNGSIVVMFPSQYATSHWQNTGNYYNAPARHWAFDVYFKQQSKLPPLTPQSKTVIRGQWLAY